MKIGILTYHFANNYGASLQAYSMQKILEDKGVQAEFYNYQSPLQRSNNSLFERNNNLKNIVKNIVRLPYYSARKKRIEKFQRFREQYLHVSDFSSDSYEEAQRYIENNYDMLIVGSDQIWNPKTADFDSIYFKAANFNLPTYVYAASLGSANDGMIKKYKTDILKFDGISVREDASIPILKRVDKNIHATGVLDPTLFVKKDYLDIISRNTININNKYIMCYYLGRENAVKFRNAAEKLADKLGLDIYFINVNYGINSYGNNTISDCGPEEFLGYLRNAALVCTNSFHAVALSIRFGVPFFTFENKKLNDTRKSDLLMRLGIMERIIYDFDISKCLNFEMNTVDAAKLNVLAIASNKYIDKILGM